MKISLSRQELIDYSTCQLNNFFPDKNQVKPQEISKCVDLTLDRLDFCFKHVSFERYNRNGETQFNHLYSDHYLMYLWYLSNTLWREGHENSTCSKIYYLNKAIHGLDCMYDTLMPDIFLIFHSVGTMLGKALYSDFFVALQGCTVGSQKGLYPKFGKGVSLTANSSVIGNCNIGTGATISTRTTIFQKDIPSYNTAYLNFETGQLKVKPSKVVYAQQFFNIDLKSL